MSIHYACHLRPIYCTTRADLAHALARGVFRCTWPVLSTCCQHTHLGNEVHTPFALLLLKLERNASNRAPLNTLHEVGHKASDLVTHPLGRDDGNLVAHPLVRVEVHGQARVVLLDDGTRRLLHGLRADTLNAHSVESSCR